MASTAPSRTELQFAYLLLKYLHGNASNVYLVLAVIAWVRQESGSKYIGNNPLNIRDSSYESGTRSVKGNGHFAVFKSLDVGAQASAALLLSGMHDSRGYALVVAAAQRTGAVGAKDQQTQGVDFLTALALSKWDSGHYGTSGVISTYDPAKNHLIQVWASMLGVQFTIPADVINPPKPKTKPRPQEQKQPEARDNPVYWAGYIDPGAARSFYEDRHQPPPDRPMDPMAPTGDGNVVY